MSRLVIDADGHISEPPELWEEFCDPEFLAFAPPVGAGQSRRWGDGARHLE